MHKKFLYVIALVGATLLVAGCASSNSHDMSMHASSRSSSSESDYDASAVMFAQMMIPHHAQAITMADIAMTNTINPEILALAQQIKGAQSPEIEQMRSWLKAAGAEELDNASMMDHGMGMSGMLSDADLEALRAASGKDFDALFLQGMIAHHQGAIEMVNMIDENPNQEVKNLGAGIVMAQEAEIATMQTLLEKL